MVGALGWERLARARAQLDAGLDLHAVLGAASVDATTWLAEEEALLAKLADEVEQGDFATVEAYRRVYRSTWVEVTGLAADDRPPAIETSGRDAASPTSLDTAEMAPSLVVAPPQDGPSCSPSPVPMKQPVDTMPMAPGLVIDEPLPFRPAEPPTLPLTPGLSSAPRLTRGK
jgi:hypothetical protein